MSSTNSLVGSNPNDLIGTGSNQQIDVTELDNGNYVVVSSKWNDNRGAVTLCNGNNGCNDVVSVSNSLVGTQEGDAVGRGGIVKLTNGNYVVQSTLWNRSLGAATFGNGSTGISGIISEKNSLIGTQSNNRIGSLVTPLNNGNYVVGSSFRDGSATFGNGTTGISGEVSKSNSLVGFSAGSAIIPLATGNYVVRSSIGASFGNGLTGLVGRINDTNTLVSSTPSITPLTNGNYVVVGDDGKGSVTLVDGTVGLNGTPSSSTSLVGTRSSDRVGNGGVVELANGNFVVTSWDWFDERGAVTLVNGNTGLTGEVSEANSLVGDVADAMVGGGTVALSNGNYVVLSLNWKGRGAVTSVDGNAGITGLLSSSNSLVGSNINDGVGHGGVIELPNGNFLIHSFGWNESRGAVTFVNGLTGINGEVSEINSLVGSSAGDSIGFISGDRNIAVLPNSDYIIHSPNWDNNSAINAGAVTYCNKQIGCKGIISPLNSLTGTNEADLVGSTVKTLTNNKYIIHSKSWANNTIPNAGAVTLGIANKAITGLITNENSVLGTVTNGGFNLTFEYDYSNNQLIVGRPNSNIVTIYKNNSSAPIFDFDGDFKTDIGIFRPSVGEWWYLRSSDLENRALQFGSSTDVPTPADFTGDGKTDISFFRNGEWFVLRSEDDSFFSFPWGQAGDVPAPGDFDGDGKADPTVFRPNDSTWFILKSTGGVDFVPFGVSEDKPVIADYDGDGKDDIAVYRPSVSEWWINQSTAGSTALQFGSAGDRTVQGDYTGDGKADVAFFRPTTGEWFIIRSEDSSFFSFPFGAAGDIAAPGDYDGDGIFDTTVFRPTNTTWFINGTQSGVQIVGFGLNGDVPVPSVYSVP